MIQNIKETIRAVLRTLFAIINHVIDVINNTFGIKISHFPTLSDLVYEEMKR